MSSIPCAISQDTNATVSCYSNTGIIAYSVGPSVVVEDFESGQIIQVLNGHTSAVVKISISPLFYFSDILGEHVGYNKPEQLTERRSICLASADKDGVCKIWDIKSGTVIFDHQTSNPTAPILFRWIAASYSKLFNKTMPDAEVSCCRSLLILECVAFGTYKLSINGVEWNDSEHPTVVKYLERQLILPFEVVDAAVVCDDASPSLEHILYLLQQGGSVGTCVLRNCISDDEPIFKEACSSSVTDVLSVHYDQYASPSDGNSFFIVGKKVIEEWRNDTIEHRQIKTKDDTKFVGSTKASIILRNAEGDIQIYDRVTLKRRKSFELSTVLAKQDGVPTIVAAQVVVRQHDSKHFGIWALTCDGVSCLLRLEEGNGSHPPGVSLGRISNGFPKSVSTAAYFPIQRAEFEAQNKPTLTRQIVAVCGDCGIQLWATSPVTLLRSISVGFKPRHAHMVDESNLVVSTEQSLFHVSFKTGEVHEFVNGEVPRGIKKITQVTVSPNKNFILVTEKSSFFVLRLSDYSQVCLDIDKSTEAQTAASWAVPVLKRHSSVIVCGTCVLPNSPELDVLVLLDKSTGELSYFRLDRNQFPERVSGDVANDTTKGIESFVTGGPWLVGITSEKRIVFVDVLTKQPVAPSDKDKEILTGEDVVGLDVSDIRLFLSGASSQWLRQICNLEVPCPDEGGRGKSGTTYSTTSPLLLLIHIKGKVLCSYLLLDHVVEKTVEAVVKREGDESGVVDVDTGECADVKAEGVEGENEKRSQSDNVQQQTEINTEPIEPRMKRLYGTEDQEVGKILQLIGTAHNKTISHPDLNIRRIAQQDLTFSSIEISCVSLNHTSLFPLVCYEGVSLMHVTPALTKLNTRAYLGEGNKEAEMGEMPLVPGRCLGCIPLVNTPKIHQLVSEMFKESLRSFRQTGTCSPDLNGEVSRTVREECEAARCLVRTENILDMEGLRDVDFLLHLCHVSGLWVEEGIVKGLGGKSKLKKSCSVVDVELQENKRDELEENGRAENVTDSSSLFFLTLTAECNRVGISASVPDKTVVDALQQISLSPSNGVERWREAIRDNLQTLMTHGCFEFGVRLLVSAGMLSEAIAELQRKGMFELSLRLANDVGGDEMYEKVLKSYVNVLMEMGDVIPSVCMAMVVGGGCEEES